MVNLERIAHVLVENAEQLRERNTFDTSMFPAEQVPEIYAKAAEGTFQKRDFESTGYYLFLGQQWDKLLEWGTPLYHSGSEEERKAGKKFLEILMFHNKLPKDIAVELADDILTNEGEYSRYRAALALNAGRAVNRAEEVANQLLNEGICNDGISFLAAAGKKLSDQEREKYSGIALEKGRYEDAFKFYEGQPLSMTNARAKAIINGTEKSWLFDDVVEHMDKTKHPFTAQDFKEFGDTFFESGDHRKALKIYKRAKDTIQPEEYKTKGEDILSQSKKIESKRTSYSPGQAMPSVKMAFDYLLRHSVKEAKQRITQYADSLLDKEDFARVRSNISQFGKLYEMIGVPIPVEKALRAAQEAEERGIYSEAAKYYVAAGMKDAAIRMGDTALQRVNDQQRNYCARKCFQAVKDKEGLAIVKFLDKNIRGF